MPTPVPRSILAKYRDLDARANTPHLVGADLEHELAPPLTPAHHEVIKLLDELLSLGEEHAPPALATLTRALRRLEPQLLESFGRIDPAVCTDFLHRLGERFLAVGSAVDAQEPRGHIATG